MKQFLKSAQIICSSKVKTPASTFCFESDLSIIYNIFKWYCNKFFSVILYSSVLSNVQLYAHRQSLKKKVERNPLLWLDPVARKGFCPLKRWRLETIFNQCLNSLEKGFCSQTSWIGCDYNISLYTHLYYRDAYCKCDSRDNGVYVC